MYILFIQQGESIMQIEQFDDLSKRFIDSI